MFFPGNPKRLEPKKWKWMDSLCLFFWGEFFDENYHSEFVNHHILVFFSNHLELSKSKSEVDSVR